MTRQKSAKPFQTNEALIERVYLNVAQMEVEPGKAGTIKVGVSGLGKRFYVETPDARMEWKLPAGAFYNHEFTGYDYCDLGDVLHRVQGFLELIGLVG